MNSVYIFVKYGALLFCLALSVSSASADWNLNQTFQLPETPLDSFLSADKDIAYILVPGKVLVYSLKENRIVDFMPVDRSMDRLTVNDTNGIFLLTSTEKKNLQVYKLDRRAQIDIKGHPVQGEANAPVTIVVYNDYQCPYCSKLSSLLAQVMSKNKGKVKLVYKHYPLSFHSAARKASAAAIAADEQGMFWEFHHKLLDNSSVLSDEKLQEIAISLQMDTQKFTKRMHDPAVQKHIDQDLAEGLKNGVTGTPAIFINGKTVKDRSVRGLQEIIDAEQ